VGYALKLGGAAIVILFLGLFTVLIFDRIWFKVGFGAAFAVVAGVILVFACSPIARLRRPARASTSFRASSLAGP
jgi:hypothetical protein